MIYINYGVSKSGSTFTFELARRLLEECGHAQVPLPREVLQNRTGREHYNNAIREWPADVVAAIAEAVPQDRITLLRTHGRPSPAVASLIRSGAAKHVIGVRDPRDIALSMLDVGTRVQAQGRSHYAARPGELDSILRVLERNLAFTVNWADIPGALIVNYEQTAFSFATTLDAICEHLCLAPPRDSYEAIYRDSMLAVAAKINVARPHRHRYEMSEADQAMILDRFAAFYARFLPDAAVATEERAEVSEDIASAVATAREEHVQAQKEKEEAREARLRQKREGHAAAGEEVSPLDMAAMAEKREKRRQAKREAKRLSRPSRGPVAGATHDDAHE